MAATKHRGASPWEVTEFHTPGALHTRPDALPDARLLAPAPPMEETPRGYRALAAAVLHQWDHDMQAAYRTDPARTLGSLARLSADADGPVAVWCDVLTLDVEDVVDAIIQRITAQRMLHGAAAAAD